MTATVSRYLGTLSLYQLSGHIAPTINSPARECGADFLAGEVVTLNAPTVAPVSSATGRGADFVINPRTILGDIICSAISLTKSNKEDLTDLSILRVIEISPARRSNSVEHPQNP
jgi:hypothetical protein